MIHPRTPIALVLGGLIALLPLGAAVRPAAAKGTRVIVGGGVPSTVRIHPGYGHPGYGHPGYGHRGHRYQHPAYTPRYGVPPGHAAHGWKWHWVPYSYSTWVWVPAHYRVDGRLIEAHWERRVIHSGSWQKVWWPTYWPGW